MRNLMYSSLLSYTLNNVYQEGSGTGAHGAKHAVPHFPGDRSLRYILLVKRSCVLKIDTTDDSDTKQKFSTYYVAPEFCS